MELRATQALVVRTGHSRLVRFIDKRGESAIERCSGSSCSGSERVREASSAQRKELRKLAHHLEPLVWVGKEGLSEDVVAATAEALDSHELIKVKLLALKDERKAVARELAERTDCVLAGVIGHVVILYREHPDADKRKIALETS